MHSCRHIGCSRSLENGDLILRTSLKGERFAGECQEHTSSPLDPFTFFLWQSQDSYTSPEDLSYGGSYPL